MDHGNLNAMSDLQNRKVPTAVFDGSALPPEHRLAAWEPLTPGYDKRLPEGHDIEDFQVHCCGWLLDDLVVTANYATPIELIRTPAHISDYSRDTYTLILLKRGEWWAELDYGQINVGSGQVCIMDFSVPWHVHGGEQENVMLVVPRAVIDGIAPNAPRLHGRLLEGASGRLFAENMLALARHLPDLNQRDVRLVRDATLSLLAGALHSLSPAPPPSPARSNRTVSIDKVRTFIDRNLTNPDLSVALICRELAVTRPTLYRAFTASKGIAGYIQQRRLEAAHGRLSDGQKAGSMAEIAAEYCFSSAAHFSTAFRRQFGYTPRDAKGTQPKAMDANHLFQTWVEKLGLD